MKTSTGSRPFTVSSALPSFHSTSVNRTVKPEPSGRLTVSEPPFGAGAPILVLELLGGDIDGVRQRAGAVEHERLAADDSAGPAVADARIHRERLLAHAHRLDRRPHALLVATHAHADRDRQRLAVDDERAQVGGGVDAVFADAEVQRELALDEVDSSMQPPSLNAMSMPPSRVETVTHESGIVTGGIALPMASLIGPHE